LLSFSVPCRRQTRHELSAGRFCGQGLQSPRIIAPRVARSRAEFIAKIGVVVEEADETVFWLELLVETNIVHPARMNNLLDEANELLAIFAASQHTAKRK
jgi:hypothetical protein